MEINFTNLSPTSFTQLCFDLVEYSGYEKIKWRHNKTKDEGTIDASLIVENAIVGKVKEKWFFYCWHQKGKIQSSLLDINISSIKDKNIDYLVFFLSTNLSTSIRQWVKKVIKELNFKLYIIEGSQLKNILAKYPELANKYNLNHDIQELINTIKKQWVIFGIIPSFDALTKTFELDRARYEILDLAIVVSFLLHEDNIIHFSFDQFSYLIEEAISVLFEDINDFGSQSLLKRRSLENQEPSLKKSSNIDKGHLINEEEYLSEHLLKTLFINHEIKIKQGDLILDAFYTVLIRSFECIEILVYKDYTCNVLIKKMRTEKYTSELKRVFKKLGRSDFGLISNKTILHT